MAAGVALLTGCSDGGIGHALALELAHRGFNVVATSRSTSTMASLVSRQDNIHIMAMDISSPDSISHTVNAVIEKFGRIDILINNAGVPCNTPVSETPLPLLESTFKTNVYGPVALIQAVAPHMVKARKGMIVNIGSVAGFASGPWTGIYASSKAALHALTDSLRVELKPFGVQVVLVAPGGVISNFAKKSVSINEGLKFIIYKPYEEDIERRSRFSQSKNSVDTGLFAKKTVDALLQKNCPRCFVYGYLSSTYTLLYHMPLWFRDWFFERRFVLSKPI